LTKNINELSNEDRVGYLSALMDLLRSLRCEGVTGMMIIVLDEERTNYVADFHPDDIPKVLQDLVDGINGKEIKATFVKAKCEENTAKADAAIRRPGFGPTNN
jgi:hypothetical protein